jgi:hypothetical protein
MRFLRLLPLLMVVPLAAACSDDETEAPPPDDLLEPPAEGQGVQFKMVTSIPAGSEVEHCQFVRAPAEGLNVNRDEIKFTTGSHHVLLYLTPYTEIPTANEQGEPIDTTKVFDCSDGVIFNWKVSNLIAGSQNATGESIVDFPSDVAMRVPPNAVLLMNVHYVNAQPEVIEPDVRINVHTIPDAQVKQEGGMLFWFNPLIRVDPMGTGLAKMSCPLPEDVTLGNAQSHMHRRGVDYEAVHIKPDATREVIYENTAWEGVPVKEWEPGLPIAGGSRIEYFCAYQNPEARTVYQGPKSSDEMCMFISSYWPAKAEVSNCASDPADVQETQNMNAVWTGQGTETCAQTLVCLQQIEGEGFYDFIHGLTDCVLASRPESSEVVSAGVRCILTKDDPQNDCQAEIQACLNEP